MRIVLPLGTLPDRSGWATECSSGAEHWWKWHHASTSTGLKPDPRLAEMIIANGRAVRLGASGLNVKPVFPQP